jgi:hypothetical protein
MNLTEEEQIMKRRSMLGVAVGLAVLAAACGGGSGTKTATPAPKATTAPATKAAATTAATAAATAGAETNFEPGELANYVTTLRGIMKSVITKANGGDLQATKDTEATMDVSMEALVKAVRLVDATLADAIEQHELAIEHEADASTTDLAAIAKYAAEIEPLLDQVVTKLKLSTPESGAPTSAQLSADIESLKKIMNDVITKAKAGDLPGTQDAEGAMDVPLEELVKAVRAVNADLGDAIEQHELAIEHEADASTTDLAAIVKYAGELLPLFDQAATALKLTP